MTPAASAARPTVLNFSYRLSPSSFLNCSFTLGLQDVPNQARCDGFTGAGQGAGVLVGGNQAALRRAEQQCEQEAERTQDGMMIAGLIVYGKGRGRLDCVGDAEGGGSYLQLGHNIHGGSFTCTGKRTGLRCVARTGHGFFFGRSTWRTF